MKSKNKERARLALAELEKEMEVLTKEQMNACKGGAVFFDLSGNYLGRYGFSDEIRIVSRDVYSSLFSSPVTNENVLNSLGSGVRDIQDYGTRKRLTSQIVNHYGREINLGRYISVGANICGNNRDCHAGFTASGILKYDIDSDTLNNASSIVSTLQHEKSHLEGCMENTGNCEVDTIFQQISYPAYNNTINDYRINTAEYLWEQVQRANQENGLIGYRGILTKNDAYRICRVEGF